MIIHLSVLVEAVSECSSGPFVDDPCDFETGILSASLVALRASRRLKYARTVMTALLTLMTRRLGFGRTL